MNHSEFIKLVNNGLPSGTYILHGEEEYVKDMAVRLVTEKVEPDLRPFNVSELVKPSPQELSETAETLPFFSERRIVIARGLADNTDFSKYSECFSERPEETSILLVFKGKLTENSAAVKYARKSGTEVVFDRLSVTECAKWCMKRANKAGVNLAQDVAQLAVRMIGDEMADIVSETDKLIDYVGVGGTVKSEDVAACVKPSLDVKVFDMLDMFTYGKPADGIMALHALLDDGNDALGVSGFLVSRFKIMLEARRGIDAGKNKQETVSRMEGSRFANERAFEAARRFTQDELLNLISALADTAYMKISGAMKEDKYLELVLLKHEWRQDTIMPNR